MKIRIGIALGFLALSQPATAVTLIHYFVTGQITNDGAWPTLFGSPAPIQDFSFSFDVDADSVTTVPALGTFNNNGIVFGVQSHLVPLSGISNFAASFGGFDAADLQAEANINNSETYELILTGDIQAPDGVYFLLNNTLGGIQVGEFICAMSCSISPTGYAADIQGGSGPVTNTSVTASIVPDGAIPEPATWWMMIAGFGLVGGALRFHSRETVGLSFTAG